MLKKLFTNDKRPVLNFVLAFIVLVIIIILLVSSVRLFKLVSTPFMLLPHLLGISDWVSDANQISLTGGQTGEFFFPEPGVYSLSTSDNTLLLINVLRPEDAPPLIWLEVMNEAGLPVEITFLKRGVRPFDPVTVPGRPVFRFEVATPGVYTVNVTAGNEGDGVVIYRDTTVGKEWLLSSLQLIQFILLSAPFVRRWRQREQARRLAAQEIASGKAQAWEDAFGKGQ